MLSFIVVLVSAAFLLPACREEKKVDVAKRLNPERKPTMSTENVSTLISDSGITQYKIVSPLWLVYDNADTPYWSFPKGLYLRKYDPLFRVIATVAADSARYFKNMRLWRLDGNVELTKAPKDLFLTQQLFWDERRQEIYSDSFIHGFISNDKLTGYRIIRPTGIFPVDRAGLSSGSSRASASSSPVMEPVAAVEAVESSPETSASPQGGN